jgi:hypothetical protein
VVPANPQALALAYKSGDMDIRHAKQLKSKLQDTVSNLDEIITLSKSLDDNAAEVDEMIEETKLHQDTADNLMELIEGAVEKAMSKQENMEQKGEVADKADAKGAVADELAEEQVFEVKRQNMSQVFDVFWAFCDVYFDEETDVSTFGDLLKETAGLFQSIADSGSGGNGSGLVISTMRGIHANNAQESLAQFFTKMLTGETLGKDNESMGKKDLGEGSDGGGNITPVQFAHLKAVQDYLLNTKAMLDKHTEALKGHASTMNAHADTLAKQSNGLSPHIKELGAVVKQSGDPDGDGISDAQHLDDNGGNNPLDEQNYPDNDLKSLSDEPSETKATTETKAEVKSEDNPTDGAEQTAEVVPAVPEGGEGKEVEVTPEVTTPEQPAVETPKEETPVETPAGGKATTEEVPAEATPAEETPAEGTPAKEEAPAETPALTDETVVDPENLSDEEAKMITDAVNEALKKSK